MKALIIYLSVAVPLIIFCIIMAGVSYGVQAEAYVQCHQAGGVLLKSGEPNLIAQWVCVENP